MIERDLIAEENMLRAQRALRRQERRPAPNYVDTVIDEVDE